jgi:NTE family protein
VTENEIKQTLPKPTQRIGLALGGGGARGLAHILVLEAFDELGVVPAIISGTSIGAIFGAAYASGMSGRDLRQHTVDVLTRRFDLVRDLFSARAQPTDRSWNIFSGRSAILAPEALLDVILPDRVAPTFSELSIPLKVVASDYFALEPQVFETGQLRPAVAASMALPVIFKPVEHNGRTLIDGGFVNPLPFDIIRGDADTLIAIDVNGAPQEIAKDKSPTALSTLFAVSFLFERSIVREKMRHSEPDIYIDGGTAHFQVLDFLKVREILEAAEPAKERVKRQLDRLLDPNVTDVDQSS